jgi:adenylylsulfate kinase-like enzyme
MPAPTIADMTPVIEPGPIPVLWICGPAGVGKSTVCWQLFSELSQAGVPVAFADIDQLCMCYPASAEDPDRERLKARNAGAMVPHYRAAGAECVIIGGSVDPVRGLRRELLPEADVTVVRLRADREEVVRRFVGRNEQREDLDELLQEVRDEADGMDRSDFADACIETAGVPAAEVAGLVRGSCPDWPGFSGTIRRQAASTQNADPEVTDAHGHILLVCGPTGVGKSTIAFRLYMQYLNAHLTAAYVDLDQIGFVRPAHRRDPGSHQLKARNLAAMWRNYHAAGATHLVAAGPVGSNAELQTYAGAFSAATITLCRLHAGPDEMTRRVMSRGGGGSWPQPGDPLRGQPAGYLRAVADRAISADGAFEREQLGSVRIDTTGRTPDESADLIAAATGWPGRAGS